MIAKLINSRDAHAIGSLVHVSAIGVQERTSPAHFRMSLNKPTATLAPRKTAD